MAMAQRYQGRLVEQFDQLVADVDQDLALYSEVVAERHREQQSFDAEVLRRLDAIVADNEDILRRLDVFERTLASLHAFACDVRTALEEGSREAIYDAVFDFRSASGMQLDDLIEAA
jgi:hypothetical protein